MSSISKILFSKSPAFSFSWIISTKFCFKFNFQSSTDQTGQGQTSFMSPSWLWCSGASGIGLEDFADELPVEDLGESSSLTIPTIPSSGLSFFSHFIIIIISSHHPSRCIRLPRCQSNTFCFVLPPWLHSSSSTQSCSFLSPQSFSKWSQFSLQSLTPSLLSTCPNQFHLLRSTSQLTSFFFLTLWMFLKLLWALWAIWKLPLQWKLPHTCFDRVITHNFPSQRATGKTVLSKL